MDAAGKSREFEKLWGDSTVRAGQSPTWNSLTLAEKKSVSSMFRKAMGRYGNEDPTGDRTKSGAFISQQISNSPSWIHG